MGDPELNMFVPFSINYTYNNPEIAFTAETKKCNESYEVRHSSTHYTNEHFKYNNWVFIFEIQGFSPCSCVDCEQSCPVGQAVTVDDTDVVELFGIKVLLVVLFSSISIIVLVITACVLIYIRFPGK